MAVGLLTYANRAAVARALSERGYSVTKMTVNRWAAGAEMPEIAARMITELFGHDKTPPEPPRWAEGLVEEAVAKVVTLLGPEYPDALERLRGRLANTPPLPHEAPPEGGEAQDPGTAAPPGHRVG